MIRILLPLLLGGVGGALALALYWLNDYHRNQLESYFYEERYHLNPSELALDKNNADIIQLNQTNEDYFILPARLKHIAFLPKKDHIVKILYSNGEQKIERFVNGHTLHKELRGLFQMLFTQSVFIIGIFCLIAFFILRALLVQPLGRLVEDIHALKHNPYGGLTETKKDTPFHSAQSALKDMQRSLQEKLETQHRLATVGLATNKISHDLRGILTNAQLLSEQLEAAETPQQKPKLQRLYNSLNRATYLCTQYLHYSQKQTTPIERSVFCVKRTLEEVRDELSPFLSEPNKQWQQTGEAVSLNSDKNLLFRILFNLGKNALEAGASALNLHSTKKGNQLELTISDNGPGLPLRVRTNLFMPFVDSQSGSSGLGLSIAHELARTLGGDVVLKSTNQQGTTFVLTLPCH